MYHYYYHHHHHGRHHHHHESVLRARKFDSARVEYSAYYACLLATYTHEECTSFSMTKIHLTAIPAFFFVHTQCIQRQSNSCS